MRAPCCPGRGPRASRVAETLRYLEGIADPVPRNSSLGAPSSSLLLDASVGSDWSGCMSIPLLCRSERKINLVRGIQGI